MLLSCLLACAPEAPPETVGDDCPVDDPACVDWRYITDDAGRAMILHGVNTDGDAKAEGLPSLTEAEVPRLANELGFNHARFLVFWSQIEPEPGVYDDAYLDAVEARLDWFAAAGMSVVIDMHQDCWGDSIYQLATGDPEYGGINGAPVWATLTDGEPHDQIDGFWSLCYVSSDVMRAFDNFWDGRAGLQEAHAAAWAHVAARLGGHPAVLGYDLMNEPWEGSRVTEQESFDVGVYPDFLQRTIDAIRAVDTERWILYEPRAFGPNQGQPSWLPALDDPRAGNARLAYYPHFYPIAYEFGYDPDADGYIDDWQAERASEAAEHRVPMIVGEYSTLPFAGEADRAAYFARMNAMLDRTTSGWAFWDRSLLDDTLDGGDLTVEDYLVRPYARAVAGQPVEHGFDAETRVFSLSFDTRSRVTGPTEIFLPEATYPEGWRLEVSDGEWSSTWDEATRVLSVTTDPAESRHVLTIWP